MATRANLTIVDVLEQLEGNTEYDGDSDDDFEGYVDSEVVASGEDQLEVGANVDVHEEEMDDSNDRQENELPEYTHTPGCAVSVEGNRPLQYLSLLVTDDMLENIVTQTNLNAEQFIANHELGPHSRVRRWSKGDHNLDELKQFFAIIILMGLVRYPQMGNTLALHKHSLLQRK